MVWRGEDASAPARGWVTLWDLCWTNVAWLGLWDYEITFGIEIVDEYIYDYREVNLKVRRLPI